MTPSPSLVVFDVVGTLFALDRLEEVLDDHGCPEGTLEFWFARMLHAAFAASLADRYAPYREVAPSTLRQVAALWDFDDGVVDAALAAMNELDARPEAAGCLDALADRGHRLIALTNGGPATLEALMERSGLGARFEALRSADAVGLCKPHRASYLRTLEEAGVEPADACMVAAHGWDVLGASVAGMRTVYVSSLEGRWPLPGRPLDLEVETLGEVPDALA